MAKPDNTHSINVSIEADGFMVGGKEVEAAARRMAKAVSNIGIVAKIALGIQVKSFIRLNREYTKQAENVKSLRKEYEQLKKQNAEAAEYDGIIKEIQRLEQNLANVKNKSVRGGKNGNKKASVNAQKMAEQYRQKLEEAQEKKKQFEASGKNTVIQDTSKKEQEIVTEQKKLDQIGNRVNMAYANLNKKGDNGFGQFVTGLLSRLKQFNQGAEKLHVPSLKKSVSIWAQGMKRIGGFITSGIKSVMKFTVGVDSLSGIFTKAYSAAKEGFPNLAQYSTETNKNISSIISAITRLKNSLATAFNPILSIVAPIISSLINIFSGAVTKIGMFIASLTGQSSFIRATEVQEDYANSVSSTSKTAKKAADNLSGLDEIHLFQGEDSDASSASDNPKNMFETVPIESSVSNFAALLKNQNWEGFGSQVAEYINSAFSKIYDVINWENVKSHILPVVNGFTQTFNSIAEKVNWSGIGATVGAGVNTIANTLNALIDGIKWSELGKDISDSAMGLVKEINWSEVGNFLGGSYMILWDTFSGFVSNLDYKALGVSVADLIGGVISSVDMSVALGSLSRLAVGLLTMLAVAIQQTDWKAIAQEIIHALQAINWSEITAALFGAIGSALGGLAEFLGELISEPWNSLREWWRSLAGKSGREIADGYLMGIISMFINIYKWIKENIFDPFLNGFRAVFEIHSPSVVMTEQGSFLMEGLFNGINALIEKVVSTVNSIKEAILEVWEQLKTKSKAIWDGLVDVIKNPINAIIGAINGLISGVIGGINSMINALNSISFTTPSWLPFGWGGKSFGLNLPTLGVPQIPYLATGAVIPPNAPFMAVLGDQRHGTNVEAPLATIEQAVRNAMGNSQGLGGTIRIPVILSGRQVFEAVIDQAQLRQMQSGRNPFELA